MGFRVKNKRFEEQIAKKLGKSRQVPDERGGFRGGPSQRSWAPPTDEILFRPPPKVTSHTCWPGHKTESQRSWAPLTDEGTSRKRGSSQRKGLVICIFPFCYMHRTPWAVLMAGCSSHLFQMQARRLAHIRRGRL